MLGTLVNFGAIIIGSVIGLVFHKAIKEKISDTIMKGLGLCIILIGIQGALKGEDTLVVIASMAIGAYLGEWIDIELRLNQLGNYVESKFAKEKNGTFSQGFVTASLLFAVGAMAIVGSLESGLHNDNSILYTKSMLDFISSMIFAGSLGVGVLFSSFVILIYQGSITLLRFICRTFFNNNRDYKHELCRIDRDHRIRIEYGQSNENKSCQLDSGDISAYSVSVFSLKNDQA